MSDDIDWALRAKEIQDWMCSEEAVRMRQRASEMAQEQYAGSQQAAYGGFDPLALGGPAGVVLGGLVLQGMGSPPWTYTSTSTCPPRQIVPCPIPDTSWDLLGDAFSWLWGQMKRTDEDCWAAWLVLVVWLVCRWLVHVD